MSHATLLRQCNQFPAFEAAVHECYQQACAKGQGEVPAAVTAMVIPVISHKQHSPYSTSGSTVRYAAQGPEGVEGFVKQIAFNTVASDAKVRAVEAAKPEVKQPGVVTLIVGCTYFFVDENELKRALEFGVQAPVLALRPQLRRRTQRTGLWFLDVAESDVMKFLAMDRCMLMHSLGTFIYAAGSQRRLRMWADARDTALSAVKGLELGLKGMKPMTIEASKEFKDHVEAIKAQWSAL